MANFISTTKDSLSHFLNEIISNLNISKQDNSIEQKLVEELKEYKLLNK